MLVGRLFSFSNGPFWHVNFQWCNSWLYQYQPSNLSLVFEVGRDYCVSWKFTPSLKLTASSPLKIGRIPKWKKSSLPTIHFWTFAHAVASGLWKDIDRTAWHRASTLTKITNPNAMINNYKLQYKYICAKDSVTSGKKHYQKINT